MWSRESFLRLSRCTAWLLTRYRTHTRECGESPLPPSALPTFPNLLAHFSLILSPPSLSPFSPLPPSSSLQSLLPSQFLPFLLVHPLLHPFLPPSLPSPATDTSPFFSRLKILQNIGTVFVRMGQYADAITSFEHIMEEQPDFKAGMRMRADKLTEMFWSCCKHDRQDEHTH